MTSPSNLAMAMTHETHPTTGRAASNGRHVASAGLSYAVAWAITITIVLAVAIFSWSN